MKNFLLIILSLLTILLTVLSLSISNNVNNKKINQNQYISNYNPSELLSETDQVSNNDVLELKCAPIDTVKIGFIGVGNRGYSAVKRYTSIKGTKIKVLCDVNKKNIKKCLNTLSEKKIKKPDIYLGSEDWKKVCERKDIDLIYIATHWDLHTEIATYAMEHGKHVAIEVPAALTIEECWKLVNTAEKTKKHCFQLENCIYGNFELSILNMTQKDLFGEIVHCEGAYIHDLRKLNFNNHYWENWRLSHMEKRDGNTYPTHAIGPISHILNIHRGDKMNFLVSMSSNQFSITEYAKKEFGIDSDYALRKYKKGDINTTLIRTQKGKTILLQHNTSSPRPYSRLHTISGTQGFAQQYPVKGISTLSSPHHFIEQNKLDSLIKKYEHPILKGLKEIIPEVNGHGAMDFIMDYRLIYCLRKGLPLDQDVYDAAEWSSIIELSERSVTNHSMPIKIPDFTRGAWKKVKKIKYYK